MGRPIEQQDAGCADYAKALPSHLLQERLIVLTGLPGTGKSSCLIRALYAHFHAGRDVKLLLSSESSHLTRRANVAPGKHMGCRIPKLSFPITGVVRTPEAAEILRASPPGSVVAFDEAQYFHAALVDHWLEASRRGVYVLIAMPSARQLALLKAARVTLISLNARCAACGQAQSTEVIYETSLRAPTHVCPQCARHHRARALAELLGEVKSSPPRCGEKFTHEPFHDVRMRGWRFVRADTRARFMVLRDALERYPDLADDPKNPASERTFASIGCGSGFLCDAMTGIGFTATGVDSREDVIAWASRMALLKRQSIDYICADEEAFLTRRDAQQFDVISCSVDLSGVVTPSGEGATLACLNALFARTRHVCALELSGAGAKASADESADARRSRDRQSLVDVMRGQGGFAHVDVVPAGPRGLSRDMVIGFKTMPRSVRDVTLAQRVAHRLRASLWPGRIRRRVNAVLRLR